MQAWLKSGSCKRKPDDVESSASTHNLKAAKTSEKPSKLKFLQKWLTEFDWLRHDKEKNVMWCQPCRDANFATSRCKKQKISSYVTGTDNFQHSALVKHGQCDDHKDAVKVKGRRHDMERASGKTSEISATALYAQMGAALLLATNDLPDVHFNTLIQAQVSFTYL